MTIPIIMVDAHFWQASRLFNPNAFPERVKTDALMCGDRLAILAHSVEVVLNEPGLDRRRLLEGIQREPSIAGFQPNSDKPTVLVFHNLSFVSGLYSALIALKSLLDFYSRLMARLLVPTASVFGFRRGPYGDRQISGGKFLRWIQASAPNSFGNRDILVSVLLANIDQWVGKAVSYRDSVVHHGSIKGMTEVVVPLDKEPHQLRQTDLVLPMMPDGVAVTDYCKHLLNSCRSLLGETLLLMPEIDFELLSLDRSRDT